MTTPDGVLVVDKATGMTSHDVVAAVRRRLPRGTKVGHTGTLDPFATGVLPIVVGKATRLSQFLMSSRKRYLARVAFGVATDSGDATGEVVATAEPRALAGLDGGRVESALPAFRGTHAQVPPAHSAKKVDGERAYQLVRRGEAVTLDAVDVTAYVVTLAAWDDAARTADVELETSAGYYVRSFARDLGQHLRVPAHLTALRRTASGEFTLDTAHALEGVLGGGQVQDALVPMSALLQHLPAVNVGDAEIQDIRQGRPVVCPAGLHARTTDGIRVRLLCGGALVALARPVLGQAGLLHADVVLV